jgi:hypothetical protein
MMRTLQEYLPWMDAILKTVADKYEIQSEIPMADILRNPRLLLIVNHSTPLSWIPAMSLLATEFGKNGGADRTPLGVADKWFYSNPLTAGIAEYITQSPTPQKFEDLLEKFKNSEITDIVIFPEGAHTFFGDPSDISEFRSVKFIEIAIRSGAPILLAVHKGSENWSIPLQLPKEWGALLAPYSKFFSAGLLLGKVFNFPLPTQKIPNFKMRLKLYVPALYESDLSADPASLSSQLEQESENVRQIMRDMFESI